MNRRHKIRTAWHRLQKQISEQHNAPAIRKGSYQEQMRILGSWDYPDRVLTRSWKAHRKTQYKRPLV